MTGWGYIIEQSFNYLVVGASFVVRTFFIWIADRIHFISRSNETRFVMVSVFMITYLNYGLIYLFASYDIRGDKTIPFVENVFDGLYPDFNALWFNDVGVLIVAIMISNMYWPPLEFFLFYGIRLLYRMIDQRTLCPSSKPTKTQCKSIQSFVEIYQGEEFSLHYKYSYVLVVVFVTMTFGIGLPVLFPIAFMSLALLYITERLMIVYSYRRPIMFNTKTNLRAYDLMLAAPVCYCIFGALMFSNQQVFRNNLLPNDGTLLFQNT